VSVNVVRPCGCSATLFWSQAAAVTALMVQHEASSEARAAAQAAALEAEAVACQNERAAGEAAALRVRRELEASEAALVEELVQSARVSLADCRHAVETCHCCSRCDCCLSSFWRGGVRVALLSWPMNLTAPPFLLCTSTEP
jgi:hypothetical protein